MKYTSKLFTLIFCLFLSVTLSNAQTVIAEWNFPTNPDNATCDAGIAANLAKTLTVGGGVNAPTFAGAGVTTRCAVATGWASGSGAKYWMVDISTVGYSSITVSSNQRGDNNKSPRDFKLQYKVGAGAWTDVTGGTVPALNKTTWVGTLTNVALPAACDNQTSVQLRWIMTSNLSCNGGTTDAANNSLIDNIVIKGTSACNTPQALPYTEPFESITAANTYPTCMTSTNMPSKTQTWISNPGSYNRIPHGGTDFASFYYSCDDWFFTPLLSLTAGVTYEFSMWYITDGNSGWTTLEAKYGNSQTSGAMTGTITGASVSGPQNTTYTQMIGTFTPATTGSYSIGIHCLANATPWYLSFDDINVSVASNMSYVSCTTTQTNTTNVNPSTTNNEIVGVQVVTTGSANPLNVSSFTFNTTGSSSPATDIANAKLWTTGTSSTFATTTQLGSLVAGPNGTFTINGFTQTLANGTNYFWLTYDITSTPVLNDVVDAQCTQVVVSGSNKPTTVSDPSGSRPINISYCSSTFTDPDDEWISNVTFGSINNTTGANTPTKYGDYTAMVANVTQGVTYTLSVTFVSTYTQDVFAWFDWNKDGDFTDPGEQYQITDNISTPTTNSISITVPLSAALGNTRMRIMTYEFDDPTPCQTGSYGETEDYTINIATAGPMVYSSCTTTQTNTSNVGVNTTNQQIIGIQIVTTGSTSPFTASSFTFNVNGTTFPTTDITNARLWSTGVSGTFATGTQLGAVVASPSGSFTINSGAGMPYTLQGGTNYFWLTYDIPAGATIDNYVDAECTNITVNGIVRTPTVTAPAGRRQIKDLCTMGVGTGLVNVSTLPYNSGAVTTCGMINDLTSTNTVVCGSTSYYTGEDVVYSFTPTTSGNITISLTSSGTYTGMMLYEGCPLSTTGGTCASFTQSSTGNKAMCVTVQAGVEYFLIIDSYASPACNPYTLNISAVDVNAVPNDLPCNATPLAMGGIETGDNTCAGGGGEPASATCWTNGAINTVWYSVVAPASGSIKFRTTLGTLTNTQIALYAGPCGSSMTMIASACNDNQATCGTSTYYNSDLTVSGLTSGITYYLRVDGYSDLVGTFSVMAIDGVSNWPGMNGQDCGLEVPVCASNFTVGDPGYQAVGANCDFSSTNICLGSGERGSAWYTIPITTSGTLMFVITPNDLGTSAGDETDYDFAIWKTSGSGSNATCASILAGSTTPGPVACNYDYLGVTGCNTGGNYTVSGMNFDAAFEPPINVVAGETYTLVISNFSNSLYGFNINITGGSATIGYPAAGTVTTLTWTGGAGTTDWFNPLNWGNCNTLIPSPTINAVIPPSSANMPIINASGAQCKSLTINTSASLGINSGFQLEVYGNITNYGTMNLNDNSTVIMTGTVNQTIEGNLTGTSAFGHFNVNKTANSTVTFLQDLQADGNFTTSNANSKIDANSKLVKVGGNVSLVNNTYTSGLGEMQLINGIAQTVNTGNNSMYSFTMQKTANSATLLADITITAKLSLNSGIINTGTYKVICTSTNASDIAGHNMLSYINGNLRKYFANNTSTYAFPMGTASAYRLAELKNNNLAGITYLDVKFITPFTNTGSLNTTICQDFGTPYAAICPEGIWQIDPNVNPSSGSYNIFLWFDGGGANAFASLVDNAFGPVKRPSSSTLASDWSASPGTLNPNGGLGRLVSHGYALRNNVTSFSQHAIARNTTPLPVSLLSFNAQCNNSSVDLEWVVASETNAHYYLIQKSSDGDHFIDIDKVNAAGNVNSILHYNYTDNGDKGDYLYRLMEFDFDGSSSILAVAASNCSENANQSFNAWFNDDSEIISVEFDAISAGKYQLQLFDVTGKLISSKEITVSNSGKVMDFINVPGLSTGVYSVVLFNSTTYNSAKVEVHK